MSKLTLSSLRSMLYFWARLLGDVQAIRKGKGVERLGRRGTGMITARFLSNLFK